LAAFLFVGRESCGLEDVVEQLLRGDGYSHLPEAQRADGSIKHAHFPGSTGQLT
jgi:hypothetical protein